MHNSLQQVSPTRFRRPWKYYVDALQAKLQTLTVPALVLCTAVLGIVTGVLATVLPLEKALMAVAGAVLFLVAVSRPDLIILFILAMSSTLFDHVPGIWIGFNVTSVELCLLFLLGIIIARSLSGQGVNGFVRTPLDLPMILFFVAGIVSFFNAIYSLGTNRGFLIPILRLLFDYLIFFAVTNFVTTRGQLMTLVGGMIVMATIVAALMVLQQVLGGSAGILPGIKALAADTFQQSFNGVARVSAPGVALVFVMLLPTLVLITLPNYLKGRRGLLLIAAVLLLAAISLTFDRNMWVGAALAGAIFVVLARSKSHRFIALILTVLIVACMLVPLVSPYFPRVDNVVAALSLRARSIFAGEELVYDSSTQWRLRENELAIPKIKEYPILGVGPGGVYRDPWWTGDTLTRYIHNGYLYLLIDLGIVGFLPFVWFSAVFVVRGIMAWYRMRDPVLKALVISFTVSYIGVLFSSVTSPRLVEENFVPVIGVMLGIGEVAIRLARPSSQ